MKVVNARSLATLCDRGMGVAPLVDLCKMTCSVRPNQGQDDRH